MRLVVSPDLPSQLVLRTLSVTLGRSPELPRAQVHLDVLLVGAADARAMCYSWGLQRLGPGASAFHAAKCEKLQREKAELERRREDEVRRRGRQHQAELRDLERRLQLQFETEAAQLQEEHRAQLLRIGCQHQEQVSLRPGPALRLRLCLPSSGGRRGWEVEGSRVSQESVQQADFSQ
ncbi:hypothetical protein J1605_007222 [Eschrichtius robustus]|uniref:Uncharacterized protein n=1 Tax=Eschrichtius robustus TaxID=9764 RepID=A0AB34H4M8_ESCRO|nr:hypothetical protein J1605_007222 [Eschrichtius robustus]